AFLLARQAVLRILHQPDIAAPLDGAGSGPGPCEPADGPRAPDAWIARSIKRYRRRRGGGGQMGDGGVGSDIDPRGLDHAGEFGPGELAVETNDVAAAPHIVQIR